MNRGNVFVGTESFAQNIKEPAEVLKEEGFVLHRNPHNRRLTRKDYDKCLSGIDYVIAGLEPYDAEVFKSFPCIQLLSRIGIGIDTIDLKAAKAHEVFVYNTPSAPSCSVAEQTIAFIISLARGFFKMNTEFHRGSWSTLMGREIAALTIGLLGFGRIGGMVAERLQAFGCRLIGCDPVWNPQRAELFGVERVDLAELLVESDILSLHLPGGPETFHFIGNQQLEKMKPGALIINTSRGGIVDDAALIENLYNGHLGGAALDVFEDEPDPARYANVPNLIASPHVGSNTVEARYRMEMGAVKNLIAFVKAKEAGKKPIIGLGS